MKGLLLQFQLNNVWMVKYIIDENLPVDFSFWNNPSFCHVTDLAESMTDSDIWNYAIENTLIIITKDTDFYYRYLSTLKVPKIVWFKTGNMKKREMEKFIIPVWNDIENLLKSYSFVLAETTKLEAF